MRYHLPVADPVETIRRLRDQALRITAPAWTDPATILLLVIAAGLGCVAALRVRPALTALAQLR